MKQIVIATKNEGKAKEFKRFFKQYDIDAISLLEFKDPIRDVEETGSTFEENAALKAEQISKVLHKMVIADDSGLVIDALDGRPGIYSTRYAGEPKDDKRNINKVLEEMNDVPEGKRTAHFVCVLAIASPGKETTLYKGICQGKITNREKGENGFGYDPIFIPDGYSKTMAQLSPEEKNRISHRKHAMDKLADWLNSNKEG